MTVSPTNYLCIGKCISARDRRVQSLSLWFSFAADIISEVLGTLACHEYCVYLVADVAVVMSIPFLLLPNLRQSRWKKFCLGALFSVGLLTVIVSSIRVAAIWKASNGTLSPPWLGLWAVIEGMIGESLCNDEYSVLKSCC